MCDGLLTNVRWPVNRRLSHLILFPPKLDQPMNTKRPPAKRPPTTRRTTLSLVSGAPRQYFHSRYSDTVDMISFPQPKYRIPSIIGC